LLKALIIFFRKDLSLELRRKAVISALGLYLVSLVFICYLTFALGRSALNELTWSALYWLTILFCVINSVAKSFIGEKKGLTIYYYSICSPQTIILSKILYNTILCILLSVFALVLFIVFLGNPIGDLPLFVLTMLLTSIGFASSLSLISGISSKANNSNIVMAVLSFPVVIGILLMAIKITKNLLDGLERSASYDELLNLFAINCILGGLAYLLFPYIWRS
jgi:heme exporter protein B